MRARARKNNLKRRSQTPLRKPRESERLKWRDNLISSQLYGRGLYLHEFDRDSEESNP